MDVYKELERKALSLIESFQRDLTYHDKRVIRKNPDCPFLHFTGRSGTNIIMMPPANDECWPLFRERIPYLFGDADRFEILAGKTNYYEATRDIGDRRKLILHYDGTRLKEITMSNAEEIIWGYRRRIEAEWEGKRERMVA